MDNFKGVIIEESLENKGILKKIKVLSTKVEIVTKEHSTSWLSKWTLHSIEVKSGRAKELAEEISNSFDTNHKGSWYADFKNDILHYIIFPKKVFRINRGSKKDYDKATKYGTSLGIPNYQVDFSPHIKSWDR